MNQDLFEQIIENPDHIAEWKARGGTFEGADAKAFEAFAIERHEWLEALMGWGDSDS